MLSEVQVHQSQLTVADAKEPVVFVDEDGVILQANEAARGLLGHAVPPTSHLPSPFADPSGHQPLAYVPGGRLLRLLGDRRVVRSEGGLVDMHHYDCLGVLAGGLAHKFNNLLTCVLGYASLARSEPGDEALVGSCLEQIEEASRQASDVCRKMLTFAGRGPYYPQRIDLNDLLRNQWPLLERSVPSGTALRLNEDETVPPVSIDVTQLGQAIVALVTNAGEAIGGTGGHIDVSIRLITLESKALARHHPELSLPAGSYATVEVRDDGPGMDGVTLGRIFEPFFSTRFPGRGLGLPAVMGTARTHGGAVAVESRPGHGATFRLYLPCAEGAGAGGRSETLTGNAARQGPPAGP